MRTAALVLMILLMFIALCLILVAINTEQWVVVTVGQTFNTQNGLALMDRTQGIIKECWRSVQAEQYIVVNENRYHSEVKCMHIGIGAQSLDMRAGLLAGAVISLAIQAILILIGLLYAFSIMIGRPLYTSDTQEFKTYMVAALCIAFFASLVGALGMVFFHASILVQSDVTANLVSLYPSQFSRDQSVSLQATTETTFGYSMWCGWMAFGVCVLAWIVYACMLCCRQPNYVESDKKTLHYTSNTVGTGLPMIEEKPKFHTIQGPPIYDCHDNLGNHFIYDPLRANKGYASSAMYQQTPSAMYQQTPSAMYQQTPSAMYQQTYSAGYMYSQPPAIAYDNYGYSSEGYM